jgi:hypothetical protein
VGPRRLSDVVVRPLNFTVRAPSDLRAAVVAVGVISSRCAHDLRRGRCGLRLCGRDSHWTNLAYLTCGCGLVGFWVHGQYRCLTRHFVWSPDLRVPGPYRSRVVAVGNTLRTSARGARTTI